MIVNLFSVIITCLFCLLFVCTHAGYAESLVETFEGLEANGELKMLTEANKHEFVRLSIRVLLWDQCSNALKAMRTGYVSLSLFLSLSLSLSARDR